MKFFIPYACDQSPEVYFQYINLLKDYIEGIYFADTNIFKINELNKEDEKNLKKLLILLKDVNIEKFYVINPAVRKISEKELLLRESVVKRYGNLITGFTVSNLYLAEYINKVNPNYKIDISSNTLLHNPAQLSYWKQNCNLFSVNVPRMCSRDIEKLKEFKQTAEKLNIKLKLILNESCVYGCPFEVYCEDLNESCFCVNNYKDSFFLKSNWISPSQLKNIENLVDIGKICHRGLEADWIFNCLIHYINGDDDCSILSIIDSNLLRRLKNKPNFKEKLLKFNNIKISKIPKKIFTCKCSECKSADLGNCEICEKFLKHYLK